MGERKAGDWGDFGVAGPMSGDAFECPIRNFYMTDPISRASEVMAMCTRVFGGVKNEGKTGTDGWNSGRIPLARRLDGRQDRSYYRAGHAFGGLSDLF